MIDSSWRWGGDGERLGRAKREFWREMQMFHIVMGYRLLRHICQNIYLRFVPSNICKFYLEIVRTIMTITVIE